MTVKEVLEQAIITGNLLELPDIKLSREDYLAVNKALGLVGGKWNRSKQGFIFPEDPNKYLDKIIDGNKPNIKKEFQFFGTPEGLAADMVNELPVILPTMTILEPSAGQGSIIKEILRECPTANISAYELMDLNRDILKDKFPTVKLLGKDFLECENKFDLIVANPPFNKHQDIIHIRKMFDCLKPNGTIVTLSSRHWCMASHKIDKEFKQWLDELGADQIEIEHGAFKESGTMTSSVMLIIRKY